MLDLNFCCIFVPLTVNGDRDPLTVPQLKAPILGPSMLTNHPGLCTMHRLQEPRDKGGCSGSVKESEQCIAMVPTIHCTPILALHPNDLDYNVVVPG